MTDETPAFAVSHIHELLDQVAQEFHALFDGHVPAEVERFAPKLATVRMIVAQASDQAAKDQAVKEQS